MCKICKIVGYEHLHRHTCFSLLDGYAHPEEYAKYATQINQRFLCITDHGMLGAVPRQIKACEDNGISPIFGCELYLNPMQPDILKEPYDEFMENLNEEEKRLLRKSYHLTVIARNEIGYKNLVRLSSDAWIHGLGGRPRRPRVTRQQLACHKDGLIVLSGCYNGEIAQAWEREGDEAAYAMIEEYLAIFGDNFYLELMLLDFNKQKPYDAFIISVHDKYHIPLVVTNDCHYCQKEESKMQQYMLMIQTGATLQDMERKLKENPDADFFELQDTNLWMKSEEELNHFWEAKYSDVIPYELFEQGKLNSVKICEKAKGIELDRSLKLPQLPDADEKFKEAIKRGYLKRGLPKDDKKYLSRVKEEYDLICRKGFSSYFLIQKQMIDEARRISPQILGFGDGSEAVGPGRGSAVGALVCYCLGITDVDPIKHGLLFSRFLSESRGGKEIKFRFTNMDPILEEDNV